MPSKPVEGNFQRFLRSLIQSDRDSVTSTILNFVPIHGESSQNQTEETTEEGECWIQKHA